MLYGHYPGIDTIKKKYYEQDNSDTFYDNYVKALDDVMAENSQTVLLNFVERYNTFPEYKCKVSVAWQYPRSNPFSMTMLKGSPAFEIINYMLLKRKDHGLVNRIALRHYGPKDRTCMVEVRGTPIGMSKVFGCSIVLAIGMMSAVGIFAIECLWYKAKIFLNKSQTMCGETAFSGGLAKVCRMWGPDSPDLNAWFQAELNDLICTYQSNNYKVKTWANESSSKQLLNNQEIRLK